ncbi:hypothetical protein ACFQI7_30765 [Paenibacillus allorhizosphaerae]
MLLQAAGRSDRIDALIDRMRPYGIKSLMRSGTLAMNHED